MDRKLLPLLTGTLVVVALALGVHASIAHAKDAPKAAPAKPALTQRYDDWYGIYMDGTKIGWAHIVLEPMRRADKAFLRSHYRIELRMKSMGSDREIKIEEELLFESKPPYRCVTGWNVQSQGAFSQRVQLTGGPGSFAALITAGGQTRKLTLAEDPVPFDVAMKPYLWFREKRAVGDTVTYRSFDLGEAEFDDDTLTVTEVVTTRVDGVPLTYYVAEQRSKRDGESGTMRIDQSGKLLSMQMMGVMEVRLEPEAVARKPGKPVDLFVSQIAKIDKPLGEPGKVTELIVEVRGRDIEKIQDGPRQRASLDKERKVLTLRLGAAHDPKVKATEEEIRASLAESAEHPIRDKKVVALAQRAVGDASTPHEKVKRLVAFVDKYVEDSYAAEPLSVLDIISVRKGDCTEHSLLFTTLARAVGVPAREVGGLMYLGDELRFGGRYGFGGHAWNEVVLDGIWVPVDATWGQVVADATHIRQGAEDSGQASAFLSLGGAELKLIKVVRKP
ncbi:MAG: transglutaminase-like domain-containing protein [Planctomycetota bacterium]|nr:transglutaminase-like domain-containing protein [Planctomycetota bacterium]